MPAPAAPPAPGRLVAAARDGCEVGVVAALADGADVNAVVGGAIALHVAAAGGHRGVVRLLLRRGADPFVMDARGRTASAHALAREAGGARARDSLPRILARACEWRILEALKDGAADTITRALNSGLLTPDAVVGKRTLLHTAAGYGHLDIVRILLARGVRTDVIDSKGRTAEAFARQYGRVETACAIATAVATEVGGARQRGQGGTSGGIPTHPASRAARTAPQRPPSPSRGPPPRTNADGVGPQGHNMRDIMHALQTGDVATVRRAVAEGWLSVDAVVGPRPILHTAAVYGYVDLVTFLLGRGADDRALDAKGRTALVHAEECGVVETAALLRPGRCAREHPHQPEMPPRHARVPRVAPERAGAAGNDGLRDDHARATELLLLRLVRASSTTPAGLDAFLRGCPDGIAVGAVGSGGRGALHYAAGLGRGDLVNLLLRHGCDPRRMDRKGRTPEVVAEQYGHLRVAELLRKHIGDHHTPCGGYQLPPSPVARAGAGRQHGGSTQATAAGGTQQAYQPGSATAPPPSTSGSPSDPPATLPSHGDAGAAVVTSAPRQRPTGPKETHDDHRRASAAAAAAAAKASSPLLQDASIEGDQPHGHAAGPSRHLNRCMGEGAESALAPDARGQQGNGSREARATSTTTALGARGRRHLHATEEPGVVGAAAETGVPLGGIAPLGQMQAERPQTGESTSVGHAAEQAEDDVEEEQGMVLKGDSELREGASVGVGAATARGNGGRNAGRGRRRAVVDDDAPSPVHDRALCPSPRGASSTRAGEPTATRDATAAVFPSPDVGGCGGVGGGASAGEEGGAATEAVRARVEGRIPTFHTSPEPAAGRYLGNAQHEDGDDDDRRLPSEHTPPPIHGEVNPSPIPDMRLPTLLDHVDRSFASASLHVDLPTPLPAPLPWVPSPRHPPACAFDTSPALQHGSGVGAMHQHGDRGGPCNRVAVGTDTPTPRSADAGMSGIGVGFPRAVDAGPDDSADIASPSAKRRRVVATANGGARDGEGAAVSMSPGPLASWTSRVPGRPGVHDGATAGKGDTRDVDHRDDVGGHDERNAHRTCDSSPAAVKGVSTPPFEPAPSPQQPQSLLPLPVSDPPAATAAPPAETSVELGLSDTVRDAMARALVVMEAQCEALTAALLDASMDRRADVPSRQQQQQQQQQQPGYQQRTTDTHVRGVVVRVLDACASYTRAVAAAGTRAAWGGAAVDDLLSHCRAIEATAADAAAHLDAGHDSVWVGGVMRDAFVDAVDMLVEVHEACGCRGGPHASGTAGVTESTIRAVLRELRLVVRMRTQETGAALHTLGVYGPSERAADGRVPSHHDALAACASGIRGMLEHLPPPPPAATAAGIPDYLRRVADAFLTLMALPCAVCGDHWRLDDGSKVFAPPTVYVPATRRLVHAGCIAPLPF